MLVCAANIVASVTGEFAPAVLVRTLCPAQSLSASLPLPPYLSCCSEPQSGPWCVQARAMSGCTTVLLHLSNGAAAVSSPRLGTVPLPPHLARQCTLIADQHDTVGSGNVTVPLSKLSDVRLCAWLSFNGTLLTPEVAATAARLLSQQHRELRRLQPDLAAAVQRLVTTCEVCCAACTLCVAWLWHEAPMLVDSSMAKGL